MSHFEVLPDTHPEGFVKRFERSRTAELAVALHMLLHGNTVRMPKRRVREHYKDRKQFIDDGDLYVGNHRCEVKQNRINFAVNEFPYPSVAICRTDAFDNADPVPSYYFIVNESCTVAMAIDVAQTRDKWFIKHITDKARNHTYPCYAVALSNVEWFQLETE